MQLGGVGEHKSKSRVLSAAVEGTHSGAVDQQTEGDIQQVTDKSGAEEEDNNAQDADQTEESGETEPQQIPDAIVLQQQVLYTPLMNVLIYVLFSPQPNRCPSFISMQLAFPIKIIVSYFLDDPTN